MTSLEGMQAPWLKDPDLGVATVDKVTLEANNLAAISQVLQAHQLEIKSTRNKQTYMMFYMVPLTLEPWVVMLVLGITEPQWQFMMIIFKAVLQEQIQIRSSKEKDKELQTRKMNMLTVERTT